MPRRGLFETEKLTASHKHVVPRELPCYIPVYAELPLSALVCISSGSVRSSHLLHLPSGARVSIYAP